MAFIKPVKVKAKEEPKPEEPKVEAASPVGTNPEKVSPPVVEENGEERIAKAVGREVSKALLARETDATKPSAAPEQASEVPKLPELELERQSNLSALEQVFPETYKGIREERAKFLEKQLKHEKDWLAAHPGEDFDPDAPEHDEFFASDPITRVPADHLAKAIARNEIMAERIWNDKRMQTQLVVNRAEQEAVLRAGAMAEAIGGKATVGLVNKDGTVNAAVLAKFTESNPVEAPVVAQAVTATAKLGAEISKLFNGVVVADVENNPVHRQLAAFGAGVEARMQELNPKDWDDARGRKHEHFLSSREFYALPPAKRSSHWTFDEQDMVELMTLDVREDAKKIISEKEKAFESEAKRRGWSPATATKAPVQAVNGQAVSPMPAASEPASPSSSAPPRMAGAKGSAANDAQNRIDAIWGKMWGSKV